MPDYIIDNEIEARPRPKPRGRGQNFGLEDLTSLMTNRITKNM